jgi:hypothetical protein
VCLSGVEIYGDSLKARLSPKLRTLEEQQSQACHSENLAVPAILCDTDDEKGLNRGLSVESCVTGDTHLEIRRWGVLDVRSAHLTHQPCWSCIWFRHTHEYVELGKHSQKAMSSPFVLL